MKYPRIYKVLRAYGFGPAKAVEILFDARRKDKHARQWIGLAARSYRALR